MVQVNDLQIKDYAFRFKVSALDLEDYQLAELGLDEGNYTDMSIMLPAGGHFVVSWEYDTPSIHLETVVVTNGNASITLTPPQVSYDMIEHLIESEDDGTWARDKADAAADFFFDEER